MPPYRIAVDACEGALGLSNAGPGNQVPNSTVALLARCPKTSFLNPTQIRALHQIRRDGLSCPLQRQT